MEGTFIMKLFPIVWLGSLGLFCIFMTAAFGAEQPLKDPGGRGSGRLVKVQVFSPPPNDPPGSSGSSGTR